MDRMSIRERSNYLQQKTTVELSEEEDAEKSLENSYNPFLFQVIWGVIIEELIRSSN